jgi:hypothetical protein
VNNGKKTTQRYFAARFQRTFRSSNRDQQPVQGVQLRCAELMYIYVVTFDMPSVKEEFMLFKERWYPTPNAGAHELDPVTKTPLLRRGLVWETKEPFVSPEVAVSQIVIIPRHGFVDRDVVLDRKFDSMIPIQWEM